MPNQRSNIESLPAEAQEQIIAWLEVESRRKVLERIAKPDPEGFGLKTHLTTLNRFYARHLAKERQANRELAKLLAPGAAGDPTDAAVSSLISDFAFQIATKPRRKIEAFKALSYWMLRRSELEQHEREVNLVEERLSLDRQKWEYDIARQVLLHHAELAQISGNATATDEEKINQARATLFNRQASEMPPRLAPKS
jgi:hypothetical protein